jgi:hypothetical protein
MSRRRPARAGLRATMLSNLSIRLRGPRIESLAMTYASDLANLELGEPNARLNRSFRPAIAQEAGAPRLTALSRPA